MQRGFSALVLILGISIVILLAVVVYIGGLVYTVNKTYKITQEFNEPKSTSSAKPSSAKDDETTNPDSIGAHWKTYKNEDFSFDYPGLWYFQENPSLPGGGNISFFRVGTEADHSDGDREGNEVFSFEISKDNRDLDELKKESYSDAVEIVIGSKPAIRTSFGLIIAKPDFNTKVNIVGGKPEAKEYIDKIISSFKFLK